MTTKLLSDVGEALYGPRWQTELSRDLGVTDRTLRRWLAGDSDPQPGVWLDLLRITQERAMALDALAGRLKVAATP
jgi:hypothetical protein